MEKNPAQKVIEKCGGARRVAEICGCTTSWVYKWTLPKAQSGRDGRIPEKEMEILLQAAARGEVDVTAADFFPDYQTIGAAS